MVRRAFVVLGVLVGLFPGLAAAHIKILSPTPRSQDQLKVPHCGLDGAPRANVQVMRPGAKVHLVWDEYVTHPGWYRISFQQNGDTFEVPPPGVDPDGYKNPANYPSENLTGMVDAATGSLIIADRIQHPATSMDITLPDVECDNCTLQLTQMMTDKPPYSVIESDDIYYQCVDLVLSATLPVTPITPVTDPTADPGGDGGSCSTAGGSPEIVALALVGLVLRRRRR